MLPSNASVAAPNTNTPGLFEMVRLLADRSAHDIKARRKQSKSTRTRMLSKHSRSSDWSVPLRCISNKPSINNGGRCDTIDAHGFANLHRHPNTANPTCSCSSTITCIDGDYNQAVISSISCYLRYGGHKFLFVLLVTVTPSPGPDASGSYF